MTNDFKMRLSPIIWWSLNAITCSCKRETRRRVDTEKKVIRRPSRVNIHSFQGYLWGLLFGLLHVVWETEKVPLSNRTTNQHSNDKSHDTEEVLCKKLKNENFFIQVDELTGFRNKYAVALVRFFNDIFKKTFSVAKGRTKQEKSRKY